MEKLSSLVSKNVLSLSEGDKIGYVLNLVFDERLTTFEGCEIVADESENSFFLSYKDFVAVGDDCVLVDDSSCLQLGFFSQNTNPIGKKIYDKFGVYYGSVEDVEIKGKSVKKIITNKCEVLPKFIRKIGDDFILFSLEKNNKKIKRNKFSDIKINEKLSEKLPKIISVQEIKNQENKELNSSLINQNQLRQFYNANSLVGKVLIQDLFGFNNELIARKNEVVNKKIIEDAKKHNKFNLLAHFSR